MKRVTIIGAEGFVGSAFVTYLADYHGVEVIKVTRRNYAQAASMKSDVVIDASCNSKKFVAEERPPEDFALSVTHRLRTLLDFPARLQVHVSSVDVYSDLRAPETTREDAPIELATVSHYGFHKLLAEQLVQHYAGRWLIVRLAGMVGPGLRKNPVYDVLNGQPLHIHPDSLYQFMTTGEVARIVWRLVEQETSGEIFNICGEGLISPAAVARLARRELNLSRLEPAAQPRVVHVNTKKIAQTVALPDTQQTIAGFVGNWSRERFPAGMK